MNALKIFALIALMTITNMATATHFKVTRWHTSKGVSVVFYKAMEVPMLDINMAFAAGSAYDGPSFGLAALTTRLLNQGNAGMNATQIAEALADVGSQYQADTTRDMTVLSLRTLNNKEALSQSVNTLTQIINHPDFPDEAFERAKKQLLMAIEQSKQSPNQIAQIHFFKNLYQEHPYSHPVSGTSETVESIKKNQVIEFYKKHYVTQNAVLVLVGAINQQKAHQIAEKITHSLPQGEPSTLTVRALTSTHQQTTNVSYPSSQTIIRMGQTGINHQNPYYFPLMVGNYILGGGTLVSRLGTEVRENRGLTYSVTSQFVPMSDQGPFIISLSTKNKQASEAIKLTKDTLISFIQEGPKKEELEEAKQYLTGSFPLSLASNRDMANLLLRMTFYHLPKDYLNNYMTKINQVTVNDIQHAFQQVINPNKLLLVTVGSS